MDLTGIPYPTIDFNSSNLPEAWSKFQQHVQLMFKGPLKAKSEDEQVSYLQLWLGDKGREIHGNFTFTEAEKDKLEPIYSKFKDYAQPKLNPIFARYKFNNEIQEAQTFEQFVTKLRTVIKDCGYEKPDEMIRDRIVFGISSRKLREKLINEGEKLTLDRAVSICQSYEYSQQQLKAMNSTGATPEVHAVSRAKPAFQRRQYGTNTEQRNTTTPTKKSSKVLNERKCGYCGYNHSKDELCKAKGQQCNFCKKN